MRFKYKYEHLDCTQCTEITWLGCPHLLCPHIMNNLDDLLCDPAFKMLVEAAEYIPTPHNPTLLYLKRTAFPVAVTDACVPSRERYDHGVKPECTDCPYPHVGFFCYGKDGTCMKTDFDAALERDRIRCPA